MVQSGKVLYRDGKVVYNGKQWHLQDIETVEESRVKLYLSLATQGNEANCQSGTHEVVILD